jgi:hypothetical protein
MAELVTIPISYFELGVEYARPVFKLWLDRASILDTFFRVLESWQPRIDDTEAITTGKPSEQGVIIKLPAKGISFFFGPASCTFKRDNVRWPQTEETIDLVDKLLTVLTRHGEATLGPMKTILAMHIQPKSVPFVQLFRPLLPLQLAGLDSQPLQTMAAVAKWQNHKVTLDGSAVLANAIFLSFERNFPSNTSYTDIAGRLKQDQDELFKILGVEEAQE